MKIVYDHQIFSLQNTGGASRYYYELLRYLSTVPEVQTEVFVGFSGLVYPLQNLPPLNTNVKRFPGVLPPGTPRYAINELMGNLVAILNRTSDIYHSTHCRFMPFVRARRLLVTHQDCTYERYPIFSHTKTVLSARKKVFKQADAIICISEATRKDLLDFYNVDPAKTRVIHLGVTDLPRSQVAARELRALMRRQYLLYVGRRAYHKNFIAFLRAFRDVQLHEDFDLLTLGGGDFNQEEAALVRALGLADSVVSVPIASDSLLAEAYAAARVFVYPSLWEGFGIPPLEAMRAGCPVVACRAGAIPEVCLDAAFYFEPDDKTSLNAILLRATNDEEARKRAIDRGREIAAKYPWEKCGAQTLAFYRECQ